MKRNKKNMSDFGVMSMLGHHYFDGKSIQCLAEMYKVSTTHVKSILTGKSRSAVYDKFKADNPECFLEPEPAVAPDSVPDIEAKLIDLIDKQISMRLDQARKVKGCDDRRVLHPNEVRELVKLLDATQFKIMMYLHTLGSAESAEFNVHGGMLANSLGYSLSTISGTFERLEDFKLIKTYPVNRNITNVTIL